MNNPAFPPLNILESYKKHPFIHKMIKESNSVEYSAHWVPEGGIQMLPRLYDSNVLIVGDAAGFVISNAMQSHQGFLLQIQFSMLINSMILVKKP
jgi:electron transfer flavoprotein-quinone oxidoreductase